MWEDTRCSILQAVIIASSLLAQSVWVKNCINNSLFFLILSTAFCPVSERSINLFLSSCMSHFFMSHFSPVEQLPAVISNSLAISTLRAYQSSSRSSSMARR